jgi:uncharacterized protein (DUF58 family)
LQARYGLSGDTSPSTGHSATFYATREYQPGDSIRHIHWRASARWGKWVLKEFEDLATRQVSILLDQSMDTTRGIPGRRTFEGMVRVTASLAAAAIEGGSPVQILGEGSVRTLVPPGSGSGHLLSILETLAMVKPDGSLPYSAALWNAIDRVPPGSAIVVLVHAFSGDLSDALRALSLRGARILVVQFGEVGPAVLSGTEAGVFQFLPPAALVPALQEASA